MRPKADELLRNFEAVVKRMNIAGDDVPPFPLEALPAPFQNIIKKFADSRNMQIDYTATAVLTAAAAAVGNSHRFQVKSDWFVPAIFYTVLFGPSDDGKSTCMNFAIKPILDLQDKQARQYEGEMRRFRDEVANLPKGAPEPDKPTFKRAAVMNVTPEKIYKILKDNKKGILLIKDELSGWINTFNQYRKGDDQEFWLSCYNAAPAMVDRVSSDEPLIIRQPVINIIGGTTPNMLSLFAKDGRDKNGFIFRLIWAAPQTKIKRTWQLGTADISEEISLYGQYLENLLDLECKTDDFGNVTPTLLTFSKEAEKLWAEWYNDNEEMRITEDNEDLSSLFGKISNIPLRLALVLEMMYFACGEGSKTYVTAKSIKGAIQLTEYYRKTALKVYNTIQQITISMQEKNTDRYDIDWNAIFQQDEELELKEIKRRLHKIFPTMAEKTCRIYVAKFCVPVKHGTWKLPSDYRIKNLLEKKLEQEVEILKPVSGNLLEED